VAPFIDRGTAITVNVENVAVLGDRMALRHMIVILVSNADRHGGDDIMVAAFHDGDEAVI